MHLVGLVFLLHQRNCLGTGQFKAFDLQIFLDDLLHLTLKRLKCIGGKRDLGIDVIVKAVVDRGTDGELCGGIETLDRLCQNVRRGVTEQVLTRLILKSQQLDLITVRKLRSQRHGLTANLGTDHRTRDELGILCRIIYRYRSIQLQLSILNFHFHIKNLLKHNKLQKS